MPKYFFTPTQKQGNTITIEAESAHHLVNVLRLSIGEKILLCDGFLTDYQCEIVQVRRKPLEVTVSILQAIPCEAESSVRTVLYQAAPKGDKMEWIIQKSVEIGVHAIVPLITHRSAIRASDWPAKKIQRFQKIAESAAEQSMRGLIPTVHQPISLQDALRHAPLRRLMLAAYEGESNLSIPRALAGKEITEVGLWIGPEGGFESDEIETLQATGVITVTLGKRILRTETAGLVALVQILSALEAW